LDTLIDIASETEGALAVVNAKGELVGEINQSMILKAMRTK
jgi:CBS-domain-containing membrane protein